jgi:hypothetical protein
LSLGGILTLEIHNQKIYFEFPTMKNLGMLSAERKVMIINQITVIDSSNRLRAMILFGKKKRVDEYEGFISKLPSHINIEASLMENKKLPKKKKKKLFEMVFEDYIKMMKNVTLENIDKMIKKGKINSDDILSRITGIWPESLNIGGEEKWDSSQKALQYHLCKDVLPSDYRFREDILWMRNKNIPNAQEWKLKLELLIRQERKARELLNQKRNKK